MAKLKDIYFGDANGDTESKDPMFKNLFYKGNNKLELLLSDQNKFIVSGQKGTGKTILGRYIELVTKEEGNSCKILRKNNILLQKLIDLDRDELQDNQYEFFFMWFIYREISKILINNKEVNKIVREKNILKKIISVYKYKNARRKLKKFFDIRYEEKNNYESLSFKTSSQLSGEASGTTTSMVNKFKSIFTVDREHVLKPFYKVISPVEELIIKCLKYSPITIILDDLDEIDSLNGLDKHACQVVIQLIEAIKNVNEVIANNNIKKSKVILLIRSDILNVINKHSSNLAKLLDDSEVNLYWIDKHPQPEKHMLMQMILHKIKVSNSEFSNMDYSSIYETLFPQKIDNKNMVNYLLDYSFGRPRDIINYLNIIKESYGDESRITATMFSNCKSHYSRRFKKELYNELHIHTSVNYADQILGLLKDFGKRTFLYDDIEFYYEGHKDLYPDIKNLKECINTLYIFGVIGNSVKNPQYNRRKNNAKYLYSWGYRDDGEDLPNFDKSFTVHFGLRKALSLNG